MPTQFVQRQVGVARHETLDLYGEAQHVRVSPDPSGRGVLVEIWEVDSRGRLSDRQGLTLPECCLDHVAREVLRYAIPDEQSPEQRESERLDRDLDGWSTLREPVEVDHE